LLHRLALWSLVLLGFSMVFGRWWTEVGLKLRDACSPAHGTGTGDESMREVRVNSERLSDSDLLHRDEAQTIDEVVDLVLVPLEVRKCSPFFVVRCPMDTRELFRVELLAKGHGFPVTDFERQRDRFGDYVIRGEQVVGETKTLERVEDVNDASVMRIPFGYKREQESRVEECHALG
jgi:hypothetical protein